MLSPARLPIDMLEHTRVDEPASMNCGEWVDAWLDNGGHAMPLRSLKSLFSCPPKTKSVELQAV